MSNYFTDLDLSIIKQMVAKRMQVAWRNAQDPFFLVTHSIYEDTGSRQRDTDHKTVYVDRSTGELYNTAASTALVAGKGFENREDILTETVSLDYWTGHCVIDRHDDAKLMTILRMTDPVSRMKEFSSTFGKQIDKEVTDAIMRRRQGLVSSYIDDIESKEAFGEKIIKSSVASTDIFAFINLTSAASGTAALEAAYNAFEIQTDEAGNRLGGQGVKWYFVNQNLAAAQIIMNIDLYVNVNYRNIASMETAKFAVRYVAASSDDSSVSMSAHHTLKMYGRQEVPEAKVTHDAEGTKITYDDYAVIHASCGIGMAKNSASS